MALETEFFHGLPAGKETGFCESVGGSADNGSVVYIYQDCVHCTVMQCMMFVCVLDHSGRAVARRFTPHPPAYRTPTS